MTGTQSLLRPVMAVVVAGLLAGCAGAGSAPPNATSASQMQPLTSLIEPMVCTKDHGVSLKPCSLSLSGSVPTAMVRAEGPRGSVFTFNDKTCSTKHIATVSGSGHKYVAVWGSASGSCRVVFTDKIKGKTIGTATLRIKNTA